MNTKQGKKRLSALTTWGQSGKKSLISLMLLAVALSLIVVFTQVRADEPAISGYTLDGEDGYWEYGGWKVTASPFKCLRAHGEQPCKTEITVENTGTPEQLTCGFVFNEKPKSGSMARWQEFTEEMLVDVPYEVEDTNGTYTRYTQELQEVTYEAWKDVTSHLTTGWHDGMYYAAGTDTIEGSQKYLVEYVPSDTDTSKKWEMWCWKGDLSSPQKIIKLDPEWSGVDVNVSIGIALWYNLNSTHPAEEAVYKEANLTWIGNTSAIEDYAVADDYGYAEQAINFSGDMMAKYDSGSIIPRMSSSADPVFTLGVCIQKNYTTPGGVLVDWAEDVTWASAGKNLALLRSHNTNNYGIQDLGQAWAHEFNPSVSNDNFGCFFAGNDGSNYWGNYNGTAKGSTSYSSTETARYFHIGAQEQLSVPYSEYGGVIILAALWNRTLNASEMSYITGNISHGHGGPFGFIAASDDPPPSANESEGKSAIEAGITASAAANGTTYTDQRVYARYPDASQELESWDKVLEYDDQYWIFNYITDGESTPGWDDYTNAVIIWENSSLEASEITSQVSALINNTIK